MKRPRMEITIRRVEPLSGLRVRLRLSDGSVVERDFGEYPRGGLLDRVWRSAALFRKVRVSEGTLEWPGGLDLCPDVVVWGGPPPERVDATPLPYLKIVPWWLPKSRRRRRPSRPAVARVKKARSA